MATTGTADVWTEEASHAWLQRLKPSEMTLGLERVTAALERLGSPQDRLKVVTIAGTNGKGSTASYVTAMAHEAGYRVGLYTSPHLVHVSERIRVGGTPILPSEFTSWIRRIREMVEPTDDAEPVPLTYFEVLTVIAFGYFLDREVDLAVMEVGLGGRLDATAVAHPLVSVITPIGYDHQKWLGDSLEAICEEKAGIIREGSTVISNVSPYLFQQVIGPRAFELRCPIRRAGVDFQTQWLSGGFRYRGWIHRVGPVKLGIPGLHQGGNAAVACAVVESLQAHGFTFKAIHMAEGLRRARHAGRMERRASVQDAYGETWPAMLLDGAHNPMAALALAHQISRYLPETPRVLLFSTLPDKDTEGVLSPLLPHCDAVVLTSVPGHPLPDVGAARAVAQFYDARITVEPDNERALEVARRLSGPDGGVLVCGSLYLLGEVLPMLPAPRIGAEIGH